MYARVITIQYQSGKMDEGLQLYREVLSETRKQSGFQGAIGLVDRGSGKAISISLWQSEADALASGAGSTYMQGQLAKFASIFAAAPHFETYEVANNE